MAELTQAAQDRGLRAMFSGDLILGLTRNGLDLRDRGYEPQSISLSEPFSVGEEETRIVTNTDEIRFGPWLNDVPDPVEGWELRDVDGTVLATGEYQSAERFLRGQEAVIRERGLIIGLR